MGVGVRHALFPGGTRLGALAFAGGVLPDATLRGMRMSRAHGGPVPVVANRNLSSEASAPGSVAPCRGRRAGRGADTSAMPIFASAPLPRGRRRLVAGRWPRVTGLTSYLSGCFRSCSGVTRFFTPPQLRRFYELCQVRSLPAAALPLRAPPANASRAFWRGWPAGPRDCVLVCAVATITLWVTASAHGSKRPVGLTRLARGF